jgi:hypothetical protein
MFLHNDYDRLFGRWTLGWQTVIELYPEQVESNSNLHTLFYFSKNYVNVILPTISRSSKSFLPLRLSYKNFECIFRFRFPSVLSLSLNLSNLTHVRWNVQIVLPLIM